MPKQKFDAPQKRAAVQKFYHGMIADATHNIALATLSIKEHAAKVQEAQMQLDKLKAQQESMFLDLIMHEKYIRLNEIAKLEQEADAALEKAKTEFERNQIVKKYEDNTNKIINDFHRYIDTIQMRNADLLSEAQASVVKLEFDLDTSMPKAWLEDNEKHAKYNAQANKPVREKLSKNIEEVQERIVQEKKGAINDRQAIEGFKAVVEKFKKVSDPNLEDLERMVRLHDSTTKFIKNHTNKITKFVSFVADKIKWTGKYVPLPESVVNYRVAKDIQKIAEQSLSEAALNIPKSGTAASLSCQGAKALLKLADAAEPVLAAGKVSKERQVLREVVDNALRGLQSTVKEHEVEQSIGMKKN